MPVALVDKVSFTLTETRLLILGAEVFLGFQFEGFFQEKFAALSPACQAWHLASLGLMLLVVLLVIAPMMLDLVAFKGHAAEETQNFATRIVQATLFPFAASLSISLAVLTRDTAGIYAWPLAGAGFVLAAVLWYVYPAIRRRQLRPGSRRSTAVPVKKAQDTPLSTRLRDILTEARIILPGVQAMLGFQMMAFLTKSFEALPLSSRIAHLAAVCLLLVCIVMLMAPPGYHRIVEDGEETERLHAFARKAVVWSSVPFSLGLGCDFYVAAEMVVRSPAFSIGAAGAFVAASLGLWLGYPAWFRARHPRVVR